MCASKEILYVQGERERDSENFISSFFSVQGNNITPKKHISPKKGLFQTPFLSLFSLSFFDVRIGTRIIARRLRPTSIYI